MLHNSYAKAALTIFFNGLVAVKECSPNYSRLAAVDFDTLDVANMRVTSAMGQHLAHFLLPLGVGELLKFFGIHVDVV